MVAFDPLSKHILVIFAIRDSDDHASAACGEWTHKAFRRPASGMRQCVTSVRNALCLFPGDFLNVER